MSLRDRLHPPRLREDDSETECSQLEGLCRDRHPVLLETPKVSSVAETRLARPLSPWIPLSYGSKSPSLSQPHCSTKCQRPFAPPEHCSRRPTREPKPRRYLRLQL